MGIVGGEEFDILALDGDPQPLQDVVLATHRHDGARQQVTLQLRVDMPVEVDYLLHGGIFPFVMR